MERENTGLQKRHRVTAACDLCKKRKVRCNGHHPCSYCLRKRLAHGCAFTASKPHAQVRSVGNTPNDLAGQQDRTSPSRAACGRAYSEGTARGPETPENVGGIGASLSPTVGREGQNEGTAVPLEGRILRDAQGKVIFIGDCAPLSFLQTVRHLIASEVDLEELPVPISRDSFIEVTRPESNNSQDDIGVTLSLADSQQFVQEYAIATSSLVDLFELKEFQDHVHQWANGTPTHSDHVSAAVYLLVLAIGAQQTRESEAEAWFTHAKNILLKNMCTSMNVNTVQGFTLVAIFMLRTFQPNGAFLYFSLAARAAYAIGLHRTEVNASFGEPIKTNRDRIWKSLRVVDQLISNLLGRPPSTSDVDCTVKYTIVHMGDNMAARSLDASLQIFMIIERVVVEVYSRKRISLRIANYVSRQLKTWASNWLQSLYDAIRKPAKTLISEESDERVVAACSTLCSYFYGIMLLTRPFLIYDLYEYIGASLKGPNTEADHQEKRKYADAAIDAASSFVEILQTVIQTGRMPYRMPLIVAWLFPTSLVLAVSILGRSGLTLERDCEASIRCLDYFGKVDPHARQYSLIVQSLLRTTRTHVNRREDRLRSQRKQASSQLFGLLPSESQSRLSEAPSVPSQTAQQDVASAIAPMDWTIYDAEFFALPWSNENDQGLQGFLQPTTHTLDGASVADIPLFPMDDQLMNGNFL
ncbi:hypothetical protein BCR34DRAFT_474322 [Clohesyomyces aquaticus]|uniref:Zn(2)-C6 fungal-type domain-containing protein n=1 Tax=Clohesyomyces aquaticus TaxID=1231657 RepID=A0A1Y2A5R3_9PLEO|nr:hypothetical protein BCR34DRAFT_474322 [Clohesyomyces aquaticus]